jgi:hypothetical protein
MPIFTCTSSPREAYATGHRPHPNPLPEGEGAKRNFHPLKVAVQSLRLLSREWVQTCSVLTPSPSGSGLG